MRKILLCLAPLCLASSGAFAAPTDPCPTTTVTLASLIASGGCTSQDKMFSNFTWAPTGGTSASEIGTTVTFLAGDPGGNGDSHRILFNTSNNNALITGGNVLSFDITVLAANLAIIDARAQFTPGFVGSGNGATATAVFTPTDSSGASPINLALNGTSLGNTDNQDVFSTGVASEHVAFTLNGQPNHAVGAGRGGAITAWNIAFDEATTSNVPEPLTMALTGAGLIGLAFLRRAKRA